MSRTMPLPPKPRNQAAQDQEVWWRMYVDYVYRMLAMESPGLDGRSEREAEILSDHLDRTRASKVLDRQPVDPDTLDGG